MKRTDKAAQATLQREGVLAAHIQANPGPHDPQSLARSYALTANRVSQIIARNGGSVG